MADGTEVIIATATPETEARERDAVDRIAREFLGTPYHDAGQVKGKDGGVDCATLIKMVFVEAELIPPINIGYYSPQHFLHGDEERYLGFVTKFAREVMERDAKPGDVVLYKVGKCFAHGAVIVKPGWPHVIHAHYASQCVRLGLGDAVHLGTPILDRKFFTRW
jgi:cell wall-associated NlpC family hydrolase